MSPADVSVVIPALDEQERVETAIQSAWANGAGQVVLCDGGSRDQTVSLAHQHGALVVRCDSGRGRQLARGAEKSTGKLLLFLHADNALGEGCLSELCRVASRTADKNRFWGGFRQQIDSARPIFRLLERGNAARIRWRGVPFGDQAMFVTRSAYDRVEGFQAVPLMEDVLLSTALRRLAWPQLINRTVLVDARRWQRRGVIRQTARNWAIQLAHRCGASEEFLANRYR